MVLTFPYLLFPASKNHDQPKSEYKPMVEARLSFSHHLSPYPIQAIMDSGSDINLFHSFFGQQVGINIKKGKVINIKGIGNIEVKAYAHDINLLIGNFKIPTQVCFSDYQQFHQILGTCVFSCFKRVIFHETKKSLILEK